MFHHYLLRCVPGKGVFKYVWTEEEVPDVAELKNYLQEQIGLKDRNELRIYKNDGTLFTDLQLLHWDSEWKAEILSKETRTNKESQKSDEKNIVGDIASTEKEKLANCVCCSLLSNV